MEAHLKFEEILQYVVVPNLSVVTSQPNSTDKLPDCKGRKDYWRIFNWLRLQKVKRVLRVIVQDHHPIPHSDEMIERALDGFGVENWDWNKLDICPKTIRKAAPTIRDLTLYSSGNNAVLRSWSGLGGLAELKDVSVLFLVHVR